MTRCGTERTHRTFFKLLSIILRCDLQKLILVRHTGNPVPSPPEQQHRVPPSRYKALSAHAPCWEGAGQQRGPPTKRPFWRPQCVPPTLLPLSNVSTSQVSALSAEPVPVHAVPRRRAACSRPGPVAHGPSWKEQPPAWGAR